jgi:outer membrane protein assembly factor BamA
LDTLNQFPLPSKIYAKYIKKLILLPWVCLLPGMSLAQAQQTLVLYFAAVDQATVREQIKDFKPQPTRIDTNCLEFYFPDSAALHATCENLLRHFRERAFLAASIDNIGCLDSMTKARFYPGPPMYWVQLRPAAGISEQWLNAAGFRRQNFAEKPLRHDALLALERRLLENAENNGHPFAAVWLDSIQIDADGGTAALLRAERGPYITFKALKIKGDVKLPNAFLPNFLGLRAGSPYSRARVLRLRDELRGLLFLESAGAPSVTFAGSEATINLFLQKKRASRFDFIIGLLPQPASDGEKEKLLLTGSLSAAFQNALNLGERLSVEIERLRPETQKLEASGGVPYLLGTPFGAEGRLHIFRRDSAWIDAQADFGVQYLLAGGDFIRFFWDNRNLSLQKVDTATVRRSRRLPPNLDMRQNGFGLEGGFNRLDYRFNPRRGWMLNIKGVAGFNRVLRNSQVEALSDKEFDFGTLYDTVTDRATRFRIESRAEYYVPLLQRSTLKLGLRGGGIFSDRPVYNNEQYRLGGNKLLRGFNEESLFSTRFVVSTVEYRLLIGQNSFLAVFSDYAYVENRTDRTRSFLRPWGFGAGMNFETRAGIFGISLAVGRQDTGQAVELNAAKFHLGYVSLF